MDEELSASHMGGARVVILCVKEATNADDQKPEVQVASHGRW